LNQTDSLSQEFIKSPILGDILIEIRYRQRR